MSFKVRLSNIGKIEKAELRIAPFTVFAGPNNTGKSFASKLLYSLFDALNQNPAEAYVGSMVRRAQAHLRGPWRQEPDRGSELERLDREITQLLETVTDCDDIDVLFERFPELQEQVKTITTLASRLRGSPREVEFQVQDARPSAVAAAEAELGGLNSALERIDASSLVGLGFAGLIDTNLINNFQIPTGSEILKEGEDGAVVDVEHLCKLEIKKQLRRSTVARAELARRRRYSRVIYLESPVYWRLHRALEQVDANQSVGNRQILSGVPGYFHDLVHAIKTEYTGDMPFPDIYKKLTGTDGIGGKLVISEVGNLLFREGDHTYPISMTATGVANLGMLALLIERKVLDKGTLLFVDEPEAHLHPAWQVLMAEALFELSRRGVTVVMATQSSDIAKWLEVHIGNHPDDKQLIAVNRFPPREGDADADVENTLSRIKEDLLDTFAGLYIDAL